MVKDRIERHRDALKVRDGYWFAPKLYGFGATPATWQGWGMTGVLIAAVVVTARFAMDDMMRLAILVPLFVGFLALAWAKTDGGWGWRWGKPD